MEDVSETSTVFKLIPGTGIMFPQPTGDGSDYFLMTLEDINASVQEIVKIVARQGDLLICESSGRGQENTIPRSWISTGDNQTLVDVRVTAETLTRLSLLPQFNNATFTGTTTVETISYNGMVEQKVEASALISGTSSIISFSVAYGSLEGFFQITKDGVRDCVKFLVCHDDVNSHIVEYGRMGTLSGVEFDSHLANNLLVISIDNPSSSMISMKGKVTLITKG